MVKQDNNSNRVPNAGSDLYHWSDRPYVVNLKTGELIPVKSQLEAMTVRWILRDPTTETLCVNEETLHLAGADGVEELQPDFVSRRKGKTYYIVVMHPDTYQSEGVAKKLDRFAYQVQDKGHDLLVVTG